jgi:uncharacterized protein with FMN-binding domain
MKKIVLWLMSTTTVLVLLFGYHTSTSSTASAQGGNASLAAPVQGSSADSAGSGSTGSGSTGSGSTAAGSAAASSAAAGAGASGGSSGSGSAGTYTGSVAQTRWGPVEVQITVANGKITTVSVPVYPDNDGRDQEINARALPILVQETLDAQNASIDMVSGATVTSDGYLESLQSALDKAGL